MIFNMTLSEQGSLAELTNIRIGADGTNYPTAGDAVRGQVTGLKEDLDAIISDPIDYAVELLQNTPIVIRNGENGTATITGNTIAFSGSTLDADKWVAIPFGTVLENGKEYTFSVEVNDPTNGVYEVRRGAYVSGESVGFNLNSFSKSGDTYSATINAQNFDISYLVFYLERWCSGFEASVSIVEAGASTGLKDGIVQKKNLSQSLQDNIINAKESTTNVFVGKNAGSSTVESASDDGKYNTGAGVNAMKDNVSGDHCSAFGFQALQKNVSGDGNTALGEDALYENLSGGSNTAVGAHTLQNCTGDGNTGVGTSALISLISGFFNTVVGGYNAGDTIETGSRNTLIGAGADVSSPSTSDAIVLGMTTATKNGQIRIGSTNATEVVIVIGGTGYVIHFNQDGSVTWSQES